MFYTFYFGRWGLVWLEERALGNRIVTSTSIIFSASIMDAVGWCAKVCSFKGILDMPSNLLKFMSTAIIAHSKPIFPHKNGKNIADCKWKMHNILWRITINLILIDRYGEYNKKIALDITRPTGNSRCIVPYRTYIYIRIYCNNIE